MLWLNAARVIAKNNEIKKNFKKKLQWRLQSLRVPLVSFNFQLVISIFILKK